MKIQISQGPDILRVAYSMVACVCHFFLITQLTYYFCTVHGPNGQMAVTSADGLNIFSFTVTGHNFSQLCAVNVLIKVFPEFLQKLLLQNCSGYNHEKCTKGV